VEILNYDWGLMDFNPVTGAITNHWPAWGRLQGQIQNMTVTQP
jgi:hypothetical protein